MKTRDKKDESKIKLIEAEIQLQEKNYREALKEKQPYNKLKDIKDNIRILKERLSRIDE